VATTLVLGGGGGGGDSSLATTGFVDWLVLLAGGVDDFLGSCTGCFEGASTCGCGCTVSAMMGWVSTAT